VGLAALREQVAAHLTERQALPTTPEQLVITAGAQQALAVVAAVAARRATVVAGCPLYPGVRSALAGRPIRITTVPGDGPAGVDPEAIARTARKVEAPLVHVMATGANPTGAVMPAHRREALLGAARRVGALVVEDLALADLVYGTDPPPPPLAALDPDVVVIGSTSKLFWAGLRVGWIRADEPLRAAIVRAKAALDLATSLPAQHLAARLLAAVDDRWLGAVRSGLAERRDHLARRLTARLPSWRFDPAPAAGLSLWAELPIADADAFSHVAARHGVVVAPGSMMCGCGRHRAHLRLSFAQPVDELDLAAERLASAWEAHSEDLAALPARA
jgi:DNA-binding transcriptional MocR family regulator